MHLDEGELRRSVDGDDEGELALRSSTLGDVDMEIADRIGLEFAFGGGLAFDLGQPGDPVALQTPVKRRAGQMRDGGLQGIEAIVERQHSMPLEGTDDGLFLCRQDCRSGLLGPVRRSETDFRAFHLAMVFGLTPWRLARALRLLDYVVSLDGPPLSFWRSHEEPVP